MPWSHGDAMGWYVAGPLALKRPLGIHRLYLGKIATGILWLFTGGLLGFGWLYDFCTLNELVDEFLTSLLASGNPRS